MSSFPRDLMHSLPNLLHGFRQRPRGEEIGEAKEEAMPAAAAEATEEGGIELSLGLSLNGRFGVDPMRTNGTSLTRSSSIPDLLNSSMAEIGFSSSLKRSCSLPAETEDECRKRKEVQTLRRLELKRKWDQKHRVSRDSNHNKLISSTEEMNGFLLLQPPRSWSQQNSIGSQGSGTGSSGISSESEIPQHFHAAESVPRPRPRPTAVLGRPPPGSSAPANGLGLPPRVAGGKVGKNVPEEMPFVFTKGSGPDGKRVEGFLYRYHKGEEVRIVCVCHGSFLSPAEFVRHAGGGDVANPMRQILVMPSSLME
ncbi:hypothetical protein SAY87_004802 [Trapa incisa]|uniref:Ninja-family protein n=1 Tax=Trapa incisa TaxID=236973 RepID=A0AAN7JPE2_9MYRT|nr:hypothetical protein SAY87_004802 [Trapa incisa]